jgi:5-methylthioadenosine/S-adenosylhomocysteine deaminase
MPARRLAARWVLPIAAPAIEHGAILIGEDGRIRAVGPDAVVPRAEEAATEEFPEGVLLPGLINAHTHLELTGFAGLPHEPDFTAWIRRVRNRKAERELEEFLELGRAGLADCYAAGVTTVADTGDSGTVIRTLAETGGSGVAYQEVFGPHPDQCGESLRGLQARVEALSGYAVGRVRIGVSPHAPYTVSGPLYRSVARWGRAEGLPIAVHVAESAAESDLLGSGTGTFAEAWRSRNIPLPSPLGGTPIGWLDRHEVLGPDTLCIHAIRADAADVALLAQRGCAVAHCPRSNRVHGHGDAPLAALLEAGIRVGVGTDSVMSLSPLDLLAEARAAAALAGLGADRALALCTVEAARALALDGEIGTLEPGKWGDCVVIEPAAGDSPAARVLESGPDEVVLTILGGRDVHRVGRRA